MFHNGIHLLLVTIFTVILSCVCSIDQESQGGQEQVGRVASPSEASFLAFEDEKRGSGFVPARGRKSLESNVAMDGEDKRGFAFNGARGKKLILYPFLDYAWKRAHMIPMRGRKDSVEGFASPELLSKPEITIASSYYPEAGWKRSLFYGSRGKKDLMPSPVILQGQEQGSPAEGDSSYSWSDSAVIGDKRAGFYGSRG